MWSGLERSFMTSAGGAIPGTCQGWSTANPEVAGAVASTRFTLFHEFGSFCDVRGPRLMCVSQ